MPLYEYVCHGCGAEFELLIRGGEQPACPTCQNTDVQKQFSVTAAPTAARQSLPMRSPMPEGGCGRPQCGGGRCQFDD